MLCQVTSHLITSLQSRSRPGTRSHSYFRVSSHQRATQVVDGDLYQIAPGLPAGQDDFNKPLKPQNPGFYKGNFYMKCYYFYLQCKDHNEIAGFLEHKQVSFVTSLLKNHIFN